MPLGGAALSAAREVQVPILALLLIGACVAKAQRAIRTRSIDPAISPTAMFPLRLRNYTSIALCASELGLGIGLVLTAGQAGVAAVIVRAATALVFAIALAALNEVRNRRPDVGCGCFGDLSDAPVTMRSLARSALLCAGAMASIGAPPLRLPSSVDQALLLLMAAITELVLLAAISPELGEVMVRLGYYEPCEARRVPVSRTLASLHGTSLWRYYQHYLDGVAPSDIWREGCWRFITYPAAIDGRLVDIVFSVYLQTRRPPVRAAVVNAVNVARLAITARPINAAALAGVPNRFFTTPPGNTPPATRPEGFPPGILVPPPRPSPEATPVFLAAPTFTPLSALPHAPSRRPTPARSPAPARRPTPIPRHRPIHPSLRVRDR